MNHNIALIVGAVGVLLWILISKGVLWWIIQAAVFGLAGAALLILIVLVLNVVVGFVRWVIRK